tara:strand:- start:946 stop:1386 length:441 start_codon:yes stop_codon:yes gene_type:complete
MKFHFDDELLSNEAMHELACEAARTIMRLPSSKIQGYGSGWPDWLRDADLAYGYNSERVRLGPPTGREIDRLDNFIDVIWASDPSDSKLIMTVAFSSQKNGWPRTRGPQWSKIAKNVFGVHVDTLKTRYEAAIERFRVTAGRVMAR